MAFPRSFKSQTWFVRLSNGEIESATSKELERSFDCGLVHARTQIRAVGTHMWTTLGEAAEIQDPEPGTLTSLSPVAMDEMSPSTDANGEVPWHVRNFGDARAFKAGVARPIAGIVAVAAIACVLSVAMRFSPGTSMGVHAMGAGSMTNRAPQSHGSTTEHTPLEYEQHSARNAERLAKEEIKRLRELDLARRMRGDDKPRGRAVSKTPVTPPRVVRPSFIASDPIQRGGNRFDPLNGQL